MRFTEHDFVKNLTDSTEEFALEPIDLPPVREPEPFPKIEPVPMTTARSPQAAPKLPAIEFPGPPATEIPKTSLLDLGACSRPWVLLRLRAALAGLPDGAEQEFVVEGGADAADLKAFQAVAGAVVEPAAGPGRYRLRRKSGNH